MTLINYSTQSSKTTLKLITWKHIYIKHVHKNMVIITIVNIIIRECNFWTNLPAWGFPGKVMTDALRTNSTAERPKYHCRRLSAHHLVILLLHLFRQRLRHTGHPSLTRVATRNPRHASCCWSHDCYDYGCFAMPRENTLNLRQGTTDENSRRWTRHCGGTVNKQVYIVHS